MYPTLLYTGIAAARLLGLSRRAEPLVCGLFIVLLDAPFDVLGPRPGVVVVVGDRRERPRAVGWGAAHQILLAHRLRGVPRAADAQRGQVALAGARPAAKLLVAPLLRVGTIVLGAISFLPFHLLQRVGVSDGANLALLVTACVGTLGFARRGASSGADRRLFGIALGYHAFFVAALALRQSVDDAVGKGAVIRVATACSLGLHAYTELRGFPAALGSKQAA